MQSLEQEHMFFILLNAHSHVIGEPVLVYRGTLNSTSIRVAELLRPAVRTNAASIILVITIPVVTVLLRLRMHTLRGPSSRHAKCLM
jgi:DNA repair protein RadC